MNAGQIVGALWTLAAWFLILSFLILPLSIAAWKRREKKRAADTEDTLQTLGFDTTGNHYEDAL